ncbi:alpha/beta fold hydrolase [Nonomuraea glycinis]|uniref:alpha/beta fold hydrolase n=1 Tax=Nonomuraea glycinis TaxID=2047744 RepID=UPI00166F0F8D|nr:alpha/beta fold hydrolase [Nonomuraea glycinis]MCA2181662.1 alpha/beta fold hydrolase [Nonomuraea glycinis]
MERRLYVLAASAFIAAAVLYCAWITGQFTTPAVDRAHGFVGELAARDQPWTRLFRVSDVLSGLACLAGVAVVPRIEREWPGWLALAAFGLFTVVGGVFPLDCAALSAPACARAPGSAAHHAHVVTGVLATAAALTAMVLLSRRWRTAVAWIVTGLTGLLTALSAAAVAAGQLAGLAQRLQVTLIAVWLVYVALRLLVRDAPTLVPGPLHVVRQGEGPAVLIAAGAAAAWCHWDGVAAELSRGHRVTRFDRPGLGLSPASPVPPTLHGEVARLAALAPAHPERVTVIAHAMAAWHAEAFARLHPLRVSALVLVDPSCGTGRGRDGSSFRRAFGGWLPALGGTWGATALARIAGPVLHRLLCGRADARGLHRKGRVLAATVGEWLARPGMATDLRRIRSEHAFPDVPVTVLCANVRRGCLKRLAGELNARLVPLPAARFPVQPLASAAIADAV